MFDIQMFVTDGTWFLVVDAAETCVLKCFKMNSASCGMFPTLVHSLSQLLLHYCSDFLGTNACHVTIHAGITIDMYR